MACGTLLGSVLVFGVGCNEPGGVGPAQSAGDERTVAEICDVHCGIVMDECNPNQIHFDDWDHCLEICTANEDDYWTGNCGEEAQAMVFCVDGLSCQDRLDYYYGPEIGECSWEQFEHSACRQGVDNPLGDEEDQ